MYSSSFDKFNVIITYLPNIYGGYCFQIKLQWIVSPTELAISVFKIKSSSFSIGLE